MLVAVPPRGRNWSPGYHGRLEPSVRQAVLRESRKVLGLNALGCFGCTSKGCEPWRRCRSRSSFRMSLSCLCTGASPRRRPDCTLPALRCGSLRSTLALTTTRLRRPSGGSARSREPAPYWSRLPRGLGTVCPGRAAPHGAGCQRPCDAQERPAVNTMRRLPGARRLGPPPHGVAPGAGSPRRPSPQEIAGRGHRRPRGPQGSDGRALRALRALDRAGALGQVRRDHIRLLLPMECPGSEPVWRLAQLKESFGKLIIYHDVWHTPFFGGNLGRLRGGQRHRVLALRSAGVAHQLPGSATARLRPVRPMGHL